MELEVPANMVATVFDLLKDEGLIVSFEPVGHKRRTKRQYVTATISTNATTRRSGKDGINSHKLIRDSLMAAPEHQLTKSQLEAIFRKHGYAIGTLVTEGNKMIRNGEIFASPKKTSFWVKP